MITFSWSKPVRVSVWGAKQAALDIIEELLTFSVTKDQEYEQVCLFDGDSFPGGFLPRVLKTLRRAGFECRVEDTRNLVPADMSQIDKLLIPLRPEDQLPAVKKLLSKPMGTMKAVTASGKGNMLSAVTACFPGLRIGIFAPTNDLINDLGRRLKTVADIDCGRITAGKLDLQRVTLVSFERMAAIRKEDRDTYRQIVDSFDVLLVDESHAAASPTRIRTIRDCSNAAYRYGFSATPEERKDGYHCLTIGNVGPITAKIDYIDLLESQKVAKALVKMVVFHHDKPKQRNSYTHFYKANIQNNDKRNRLLSNLIRMCEKPMITFVTMMNHGSILMDMIKRDKQFDAVFAHGKVSKERRTQIIREANEGRIEVIVGSKIFDTGIDIPRLQTVMVADCGVSSIKSRQKTGRGMRVSEGKTEFTLIDIYDAGFRNGDGKPIAFERQSVERMKTYSENGFEIELVEYDERTKALVPYEG